MSSKELTLADVHAVQPIADSYVRTMADHHRDGAANCEQAIADARRIKAQADVLIDARVQMEKDRHEAELLKLAGLRDVAKLRSDEAVAEKEHELNYHRTSLSALPKD